MGTPSDGKKLPQDLLCKCGEILIDDEREKGSCEDCMSEKAKIICSAINIYGEGSHPWATPENLNYFQREYVQECLEKAKDNLKDEYKEGLDEAILELVPVVPEAI